MKLAIIAGGKGTRLGLKDIPKPMVKFAGTPLLEHQIELAKRYGIKDIFLLSGHLSDVIVDYFGDGKNFGVNITHLTEPYPLGTAGSINLLENYINERFMVFYGDIVMDLDLDSFIKFDKNNPDSLASILVHPNDHPYDSDLVEIDMNNQITAFHSKPHNPDIYYSNLVNAAVYILSPGIFEYIPDGINTDFGKNIFPDVLNLNEKIFAYKSAEYVRDMGTPDRMDKSEKNYLSGMISRLNKKNKRSAIFLDRDGVINKDVNNLSNIDDFELLDNVSEAIKKINKSEYLSILVTNQPVIAKGFLSYRGLNEIHKKMETLLGSDRCYLDDIYFCPHHTELGFDGEIKELKIDCECRKPKPGMLLSAAKDYNIDLESSWMIGDREVDLIAGKLAGCRTIHIRPENGEKSVYSDFECSDLLESVEFILENVGLLV